MRVLTIVQNVVRRPQSVGGDERARHERKCRRPAAALPPYPPPLLSTRAPPSSGGLGRVEERGRREVPLGGLARRNNRRLRHALRLDRDAPPLALGAGHLTHPLDPRGGRDVRAKQVVGERAADLARQPLRVTRRRGGARGAWAALGVRTL